MCQESYRVEHDSMGKVRVDSTAWWGAQTQRSLENFPIGCERMPAELIHALVHLKRVAAIANAELGVLGHNERSLIVDACDEILSGELDEQFPLVVWQTGSGTQTNMNVNEVIAYRANQLARERGIALSHPIHPNDDVNRSQSSNDVFPSAMHVAAVLALSERLLPAARSLCDTFGHLEAVNEGIIKSGRTHLQDAVPISFSQEISGWRGLVEAGVAEIDASLPRLRLLALGGTAVGTGLNAPDRFDTLAIEHLCLATGQAFEVNANKFAALTGKDALVVSHGSVKALAVNLMKIANDIRWLASGPRLGLGEITIPANEPGSSIMPGKVNPTQCEAVTMVAVQVMGNDAGIGFAASQGNFELNVFMPVIIYEFLQSVRLLTDVIASFDGRCVSGIVANRARMADNLHNSLMLVTSLNPHIGYERAAQVAQRAYADNISLRDACVALGYLSAREFDEICRPEDLV